jgi:hypothetical protein
VRKLVATIRPDLTLFQVMRKNGRGYVQSVPDDPDGVIQPKELIVSLSMRSKRRDIRQDLVPASGDTRRVGPAFNARLITFIENLWRVDAAERSSPSLRKAVNRLRVAF